MIRLITFLFLAFISTFSIAQEIESGVIAIASNPVKITNAQGEVRIAKTGDKIYLNDTIQTDAQGKTQILLKDQMTISLGPNSQMVVDKFVYDPKEKFKNELSTQIKQGAFKFISGKIASDNKDAMKVSTPKATIAIRGTAVAGNVELDGASTIILLHGAISLINDSNSVDITKSGYGAQITNTGAISSPVPIPASTIKSITTSVQVQASNTGGAGSSSLSSNNSDSSLSNSGSNNNLNSVATFNNINANTYQNLNQTLLTQGAGAATAAYFNLYGININDPAVDINYALHTLPPAAQLDLLTLTKAPVSLYSITSLNWGVFGYATGSYQGYSLNDASTMLSSNGQTPSQYAAAMSTLRPHDLTDFNTIVNAYDGFGSRTSLFNYYFDPAIVLTGNSTGIGPGTYTSAGEMLLALSALTEPLNLPSFTTGSPPTINYLGIATPIQNVYFDAGSWGITSPDSSLRGNITQQVNLDFARSILTNSYSVNFTTAAAQAIFADIPSQNIAINFNQLKTLGNNPNLVQLPTNNPADGSNLTMTGSFVVNNKSVILPNPATQNASNIPNASAAFLGAYISKGDSYLIGTQVVPGVINH